MIEEISIYGRNTMLQNVQGGLEKRGVKVHQCGSSISTKHVICWGWRKGEELRRKGHEVLVFERGYLGDRFKWTSIGWNGLNNRADFKLPDKVTGERFKKNFEMKPWQPDGDLIIIMGQIMGDMSLQGKNLTGFYNELGKSLKKKHGKQVVFRPHPHAKAGRGNFKPDLPVFDGNLEDALKRAYLVVTYNSNSAVDAVINGIPALSFDIGSMAYDVTGHSASERIKPERQWWADILAHCQWTPEEIANGDYWGRMSE
jgi:hypothetical protein